MVGCFPKNASKSASWSELFAVPPLSFSHGTNAMVGGWRDIHHRTFEPKTTANEPSFGPRIGCPSQMLCQILVINIYPNQTISKSAGLDAIAITPSRGPLWVAHYGCHWKMTTHTHITRYHRWRPGTVCPTSAVSGRVCRTCFPDSPGIWAERRIVSHLLINPAY